MKFFFYCFKPNESTAAYQHNTIALAEGLQELGHKTYSNIDYWQVSEREGDYLLINDDEVHPMDCDYVILNITFPSRSSYLSVDSSVFDRQRTYKIILVDSSDGLNNLCFYPPYSYSDVILKTHYNRHLKYPNNFFPWQFGLTNRIIQAVNPVQQYSRNEKLMVNFRVNHHLRELAKRDVLPIFSESLRLDSGFSQTDSNIGLAKLYHENTGGRHNTDFYNNLSKSSACFCFGGFLKKKLLSGRNPVLRAFGRVDYRLNLIFFQEYDRVVQFDSWRLWESWVAGCCPVHVDFDKYGVVFPEMPQNYEHYLGVDLSNLTKLKEFIRERGLDAVHEIGENGKNWVLKHYSPANVAERLLEIV